MWNLCAYNDIKMAHKIRFGSTSYYDGQIHWYMFCGLELYYEHVESPVDTVEGDRCEICHRLSILKELGE